MGVHRFDPVEVEHTLSRRRPRDASLRGAWVDEELARRSSRRATPEWAYQEIQQLIIDALEALSTREIASLPPPLLKALRRVLDA